MRSRVKWVEEGVEKKKGGKKKQKALNLENSRANSKIMERVTDEKGDGRKGADIYEAGRHCECSKRLFFF